MEENQPQQRLRAVLVGCGAIAHAQAAAFLAEGVDIEALVDPAIDKAETLAGSLGIQPRISTDLSVATTTGAQLAVVCSPPWEHGRQCVELLERGIHVLCEKPLALTGGEATATLAAAQRAGRVLGVGMVRRFMGQSEVLKEIVGSGFLGQAKAVRVRESMFGWPLSKGMLDPAGRPVGTLADSGTHALDLLQWLFGPLTLNDYQDNSNVGEESFCRVDGRAGETSFELHLMRRVAVSARWTIDFERGRVSFSPRTSDRLEVQVPGTTTPLVAHRQRDAFRHQASNFIAAVRGRVALRSSIRDSESLAAFIDSCHRARAARPGQIPLGPEPTILVTGGTGNVGSRLLEILADRGELGRFKFLIRNYDNAADLCRVGARITVGDLMAGPAALDSALSGCTKVLHLGAGPDPGFETRSLALAARKAGVSRFVHFSTANVFGMDLSTEIERQQEKTALRRTGDTYCDGKASAELVLSGFQDLNPVILRPHIVYGPGMRWTFDLASQLESDHMAVVDGEGFANLIYVDDLVDCALRMLDNAASGGYFVTDNAPVLWRDYIDTHARLLGHNAPPRIQVGAEAKGWRSSLAASGRALRKVIAGDEFREFLTQDPLAKATIFRLYLRTREVGVMRRAKAGLQKARADQRPIEAPAQWLSLQSSRARLSSDKLLADTGFKAAWPFSRGVVASIEWLRGRGY